MWATAVIQKTSSRRILAGVVVAVATFLALGTVAALWENPLFIRMTPAGEWEIGLLSFLALLSGIYVGIRRPLCSNKTIKQPDVWTFGFMPFSHLGIPI